MEEIAIEVKNISKVYKLYAKQSDRIKEAFSITGKKYHKDFTALSDVSFKINKGEMLGIIGKNGAGKSTMLKIITGVLTPTAGELVINGKISALLELGAGFNPEYTGIENAYLNGTMIGFTQEEMDSKIDDIIAFADIGDFIYQPVKTYSSGMFARLAFAVAINVDPDILIVDEALSVGDAFFQSKCYKKMDELKKSGKTILFVSHDMGSIIKYCDRAIIIDHGTKIKEGSAEEMVNIYKRILVNQYDEKAESSKENSQEMPDSKVTQNNSTNNEVCSNDWKSNMLINPNKEEYGDGSVDIIDFGLFDINGEVTNTIRKLDEFYLKMKIQFHNTIANPIFAFSIKDLKGTDLCGTNTFIEEVDTGTIEAGEIVEISFKQKMMLQNGQYLLQLGCTGYHGEDLVVYKRLYDICCIQVISDKITNGYFDVDAKVEIKRGLKNE